LLSSKQGNPVLSSLSGLSVQRVSWTFVKDREDRRDQPGSPSSSNAVHRAEFPSEKSVPTSWSRALPSSKSQARHSSISTCRVTYSDSGNHTRRRATNESRGDEIEHGSFCLQNIFDGRFKVVLLFEIITRLAMCYGKIYNSGRVTDGCTDSTRQNAFGLLPQRRREDEETTTTYAFDGLPAPGPGRSLARLSSHTPHHCGADGRGAAARLANCRTSDRARRRCGFLPCLF
jgi:hypothetical protein